MYYFCKYYCDCWFLILICLFEIIELKKNVFVIGGGGGIGNIYEKCIYLV